MPAYVSLAASPAVLVGDVPTTMAALTERVKLVLKLENDVNISLQYQNASGARVYLSSDSDLEAAGSGLNALFADVVEEWVWVDASDPDNTHASVPAPLIVSLSDDYVHIQVKPPEAPLLESDFQHPQHKNQVSHDIDAPPAAVAEQKDASLAFAFEQPSVNGVGCPTKSVKDVADARIRNQHWRRCTSREGGPEFGQMVCSNLEHDQYEVLPAERNGHCLFLCFVDILRERNVAGRPCTHQAMRGAIADYFDQHGGTVTYRGVQYPCDEAIRTNGYGGVTEALAFAAMYSISIEMHCPETSDVVQEISCGSHDAATEMLLQTLAWNENGSRAPAGDHWQRLRKKPATAAHHRQDGHYSFLNHEWETQPTSSGSFFFRHKVTGETRWDQPPGGFVSSRYSDNDDSAPPPLNFGMDQNFVSKSLDFRTNFFNKRTEYSTVADSVPSYPNSKDDAPSIVKALLMKGADIDARDAQQRSLLHLACAQGYIDDIKMLLDAGADIEAQDELRQTSLHCAAANGRSGSLRALLHKGAVIQAKDTEGRTALHLASMQGHADSVKLLIDRGATIEAKDNQLSTPLHNASAHGHSTTVKVLIEAGAVIDAVDASGKTPPETAVLPAVISVFDSFMPSSAVLKLRSMLKGHIVTSDFSALPSPSSIASAIQRLDAGDVGRCQSLSIAKNHLKSGGVGAIAESLLRLSSLANIDMSNNPELGDSGVACLLKSLPAHVTSVNIGETGLKDISQELANCFSNFSCLISLDISDNAGLSNNGMKFLLQALPNSLKSLSMCNLRLNYDRVKSVEVMLSRFKGLEALNLSFNEDSSRDFDSVVDLCCHCFPSLQTLDLSYLPALLNVPPMVSLLHDLRTLIVNGCENLVTLPDELEGMTKLKRIDVEGCKSLELPPLRIALQGTEKIKEYLCKAKAAKPLKKCKIVFLGNGRSGKTSLLYTLADLPMNPFDAPTHGISSSPDFAQRLQPDRISRYFQGVPKLCFLDLPGQLEYSAAHEFFMSRRQAVYVVIFSTVEDLEAQIHQVTYWLRMILTRELSCVRVVIVGSKIDLIEPQSRLAQELQGIESFMLRAFNSIIQKVAPYCQWSASVKFVTSDRNHPNYKKRRIELQDHIFHLSADIFTGLDRTLRFPQEYSQMNDDVKGLREQLRISLEVPIVQLSDQHIITPRYRNLYGAHTNSKKLEALKILGDLGELIYYEVGEKQTPWICVEPQLIASAFALFANPGRRIQSTSSRADIFAELYRLDGITHDDLTHQKLFDFLLALKVVIRASESSSINHGLSAGVSPAAVGDHQYLIPLAFKGRPGFWSEVVDDVKSIGAIRGVRFTSQRMISVSTFVRAMSLMCSQRQHMWGCAFFSQVNDVVSVFVRLAESRCAVDVVVLGPPEQLSSEEVQERLHFIIDKLGCSRSYAFLCPQCCLSDAFLRSGNAHAFYLESESPSAKLPAHTLLSCSRYHAPSVQGVKLGVPVDMAGTAEPLLTDDALRSKLPWRAVYTGLGVLAETILLATQRTFSGGEVVISFPSDKAPSDSSEVIHEDPVEKHLRFRGTLLPNSFFVLTKQLFVDDVFEEESLHRLLIVVTKGGSLEHTVPVRVLRKEGSSHVIVEPVLKVVYFVADSISDTAKGVREIESILSLSLNSEVCEAQDEGAGILFVRTASPHHLQCGSRALICLSADAGGGVLCEVVEVVSEVEMKIVQANNPDDAPPKCVGATVLPCLPSFGPSDNVLVMYTQTGKRRAGFDLFAGRREGLELAQLTPADCSGNNAVSACWRDVKHHWEVMLGAEFKNYEMSRVTMFRNRSREEMFFRELHDLKASAALRPAESNFSVVSDSTPAEQERRQQLQMQTMGHFNEFAEKFSLLPKRESKDVNLCVAWWGKMPAAYLTNAQHGLSNLPSHLKLDPGWFGEGFYFTQYPRYSDYYISGCSMSSRNMDHGHILLCYAALGRPYPVTQNPFAASGSSQVPPSSLCGKRCGPQCGGSDSHDCHYANVKKDAASQGYYPCPWRQQPDFDELVMFKSERILPVAYVSFQRRRKTLLWLDDWPDTDTNLSIRSKIPGARWFDEMEGTEQRTVTLKPGNTERKDGVAAVSISGATGLNASAINGVYVPGSETHCQRPVYRKKHATTTIQIYNDGATDDSGDMCIEYDDVRQQWQVKNVAHRGNGGWALASIATPGTLEECSKSASWKVVTSKPKENRVSFSLNIAASDPKLSQQPLNREDQVDLTLFKSVAALVEFLSDDKQAKFAKYPPSLFRILCNRRLFIGTVVINCCSKTEFLSTGISGLLSCGSEIQFEGERLFGGVEAGVTYYITSFRRQRNKEYFSVSREVGGPNLDLLQTPNQAVPMIVRASQHSLLNFLETNDEWRLSYPATCLFHMDSSDEMRALRARPNFMSTVRQQHCESFVAFEPMAALQELN